MGFLSIVNDSLSHDKNPSDFLSSIVYMLDKSYGIIGQGILTTVGLSVFGTLIAFVLAILLVFLRIQQIDRSDNDAVRFFKTLGCEFAKVYSTVVRGTPMMVQGMLIYFAGFGLLKNSGMTVSEIGRMWSTFVAGLVTISLNSTAYMMEVLRGGIEAVDPGQNEAARSLGPLAVAGHDQGGLPAGHQERHPRALQRAGRQHQGLLGALRHRRV